MTAMKNKYIKNSKISQSKFREILKYFSKKHFALQKCYACFHRNIGYAEHFACFTLLHFVSQETCHFVAPLRLFSQKHRLRRALRLFWQLQKYSLNGTAKIRDWREIYPQLTIYFSETLEKYE